MEDLSTRPYILNLMGPTGAGKTNIAIELVQYLPCDIISVDSSMVYKYMDIGTAKPTPDKLMIAPHRLIDLCDPDETYSAGQFRIDALREIEDILSKNRLPLLVGGTMLYFRALHRGISKLPTANKEIRSKLKKEADKFGWLFLYERLKKIDPISAERIHPNDLQRLQRALEVYELTGKTMTQLFEEEKVKPLPYRTINLGIKPSSREILCERIVKRVDEMLKIGFIEEVENIISNYPNSDTALKSVGYRQIQQYLEGKLDYEEMREKIIIATRQLAKHQITWLRKWANLQWFNSEDNKAVEKILYILQSNYHIAISNEMQRILETNFI